MNMAPVALFVYNRPVHTRRTVEALLNNPEASKTDLHVFSDHPKDPQSEEAVSEVRRYIRQLQGFRNIEITEQHTNQGLARSIISGVNSVCSSYGRVIVFEDDLVASPRLLKFMNDALEFYENYDNVAHVSGYTYPIEASGLPETYFLRLPMCWGWGTWWRAWQGFEKTLQVMERFDHQARHRFDFDSSYGYWRQLELNRAGTIDTWFIFWYANVFLNGQLCLFPKTSLIDNIGHDGTGVHCGSNADYGVTLANAAPQVGGIPVVESEEAYRRHVRYFKSIRKGLGARAIGKAARFLKRALG